MKPGLEETREVNLIEGKATSETSGVAAESEAPRLAIAGYVLAAFLLSAPSLFYWNWQPFRLTRNEFDFFIGMERAWPWLGLEEWFWIGKFVAALLFGMAGICFGWIALKHRPWIESLSNRKLALATAVLSILYVSGLPWISPDVFYNIGGGWMEAHYHADIYTTSFIQVTDPRKDPIFANIVPVFWYLKGNYGPLHQNIASLLAPLSLGSPQLALVWWKAHNLTIVLVSAATVSFLASRFGVNRRFAFFCYACNPLILFALVTAVHNDAMQNLLVLLTLASCVTRSPALSGVCLGGAIAYKLTGIALAPALVLFWLFDEQGGQRIRNVTACTASLLAVVIASFASQPSALAACFGTLSDHSWMPTRSSIYIPIQMLLENFNSADNTRQLIKAARKIGPFVFVACGAFITLAPALRRKPGTPYGLTVQAYAIFACWLLLTPTVTEWYITWMVGLGIVQRNERIQRGVIFLSAFYLVPIVFIIRAGSDVPIIANLVLFVILAYGLLQHLQPTPKTGEPLPAPAH